MRLVGCASMERVMRRIMTAIWIALATAPGLLVLLAAPVSAQFKSVGTESKDPNAGAKKKVDDSQYKAAIERLPEKKFDPWQNMR
jgi:hypothetical protein